MELEPNRKLFPDHLPSILHGAALVGAGSLWPLLSVSGGGSFTGIQNVDFLVPFRNSDAASSVLPGFVKGE